MARFSSIPASKLVELVNRLDTRKNMHVLILSRTQLALGVNPLQPSHTVDLGKEEIGPYNPAEKIKPDSPPVIPEPSWNNPRATRRGGDYWFEIKGRRIDCRSLRELLSKGLIALEQNQSGTLDKLSHLKPRSKRIVARNPKELFDQEHLAEEFSEKLMDGWWFGTNNSARETNSWLERACAYSGLKWGIDFKTSLTKVVTLADF